MATWLSGNATVTVAGIDAVLLKKSFVAGWDSIRRGAAFDYSIADQTINYERGRQAALVFRSIHGFVPPLPAGLELLRPLYISLRLDQILCGEIHPTMLAHYADANGKFSPQKYIARSTGGKPASASSLNLF